MSVLFSGVLHISGEADTGKTMFAFSCGAAPEDIAFIDDDVKGVAVVEQLRDQGHELGYYRDLVSLGYGLKELQFHAAGINIVTELTEAVKKRGKKFECLVWDTFARYENTFHPFIATYPQNFRALWSPKGDIKGAEQWNEAFRYESEFINKLQGVAKLVILTSHLKPENIAGRKTGKNIPDAKKPLTQKSILRVYLRHNPDGPQPIGLILKRPSKQIATKDGIKIVSILPRKMKPFTWDEIRRYWADPIGDRKLTADENPDAFELSILEGSLTQDQMEIMRMYNTPPVTTDDEPAYFPQETIDKVVGLKAEGKTLPVIGKETGLTIKEVNQVLGK